MTHCSKSAGNHDIKFCSLNLRRRLPAALNPAKQSIGHKRQNKKKIKEKDGGWMAEKDQTVMILIN